MSIFNEIPSGTDPHKNYSYPSQFLVDVHGEGKNLFRCAYYGGSDHYSCSEKQFYVGYGIGNRLHVIWLKIALAFAVSQTQHELKERLAFCCEQIGWGTRWIYKIDNDARKVQDYNGLGIFSRPFKTFREVRLKTYNGTPAICYSFSPQTLIDLLESIKKNNLSPGLTDIGIISKCFSRDKSLIVEHPLKILFKQKIFFFKEQLVQTEKNHFADLFKKGHIISAGSSLINLLKIHYCAFRFLKIANQCFTTHRGKGEEPFALGRPAANWEAIDWFQNPWEAQRNQKFLKP